MSKKTQAKKKLKREQAPKPGNARDRMRAEVAVASKRAKRRNVAIAAIIVVAIMVATGVGFGYFWSKRDVSAPQNSPGQFTDTAQTLVKDNGLTWGSGDGTLRVYFDFNCSHCVDFEKQYGEVITEAAKSGKWKVELYPLAFLAPSSLTAANAFACAAKDGYGYAYQRGIFANAGREWNQEQLTSMAAQVTGAEATSSFTSCLKRHNYRETVQHNTTYAMETLGVSGTPYVAINNKQVDLSELTVEKFKQQLGL